VYTLGACLWALNQSWIFFQRKITRLVSLIVSIEFNGLLGWNFFSNEFIKETWEARRILTQTIFIRLSLCQILSWMMNNDFVLFPPASRFSICMSTQDFLTTEISLLVTLTLIFVILHTYGDRRTFPIRTIDHLPHYHDHRKSTACLVYVSYLYAWPLALQTPASSSIQLSCWSFITNKEISLQGW